MSYDDWKKYSLDDVCIRVTDGSHYSPKETGGNFPMLSVKDMRDNGFDYSSCKMIGEIQYKRLLESDCVPQVNDVLVAKDGSYMKHVFVTKVFKEEAILSSIAILRPDLNKILPDFLKYYFLNPSMKNNIIENYVSGSAVPRIVLKDFKKMMLYVPNINKQRAIANILSSLDDKIQLNNRINQNLEMLAQTLYKHWFVDFEFPNEDGEPYKSSGGEMVESELGMIPMGWEVSTLSSIANYKNGLAIKKYAPIKGEKSIPVLKIKELRNGDCDENSDRVTVDFPEDYIIHNGDLIFSWSGTLMVDFWTGRVAGLNQHLFKVDSNKYDRWFYYYWTSYHLARFQNIASSMATTMGHIKRSDLNKSKVLIPSDTVLSKGLGIFEPIIAKMLIDRNEINKLVITRDTLLPKLMNGEIEVLV